MARVTVEDCLPLVDNRFALVLLATKRARQLMAGARPAIEAEDQPPGPGPRQVATRKGGFHRPPRAALAGQDGNEQLALGGAPSPHQPPTAAGEARPAA